MKFFKNNKALTLIELIISVTISSILFLIVFLFISDSVEQLANNHVKMSSIDESFEFKDKISRFARWWFTDATIINWTFDSEYTGSTNPNPNSILYLKKFDWTEWLLIWIVDIETKKMQKNYTYWDNFLAYKYISKDRMDILDNDNNLVFDEVFTNDKIFQWLRMKDFNVETYNDWNIIDIYYTVINLFDDSTFFLDFADFYIDELVIDEYNLVY